MQRHWLPLLVLTAATTLTSFGCRSCSSCHDYDPPVAGCDCNTYGGQRAGSACCGASSGYASEEGEYVEGETSEYVVEPTPEGQPM